MASLPMTFGCLLGCLCPYIAHPFEEELTIYHTFYLPVLFCSMPVLIDQIGRTVVLHQPARRIVSLVPSQTEVLYHLGLDAEVVGITKFCVHPLDWWRTKQRIGGTKDIHISRIQDLQPDLVIANKEENVQEQVAALWNDVPVYVSDVANLPEALGMIRDIGVLTGKAAAAQIICNSITTAFDFLKKPTAIKVAYLIWREPYMTVGSDTFIHQMLAAAGFENVFAAHTRYPAITVSDLQASGCDLVLLSSEPYPFKEKHLSELSGLLPGVPSLLVDGEMFSWFGTRLQYAPAYFQEVLEHAQALVK